VGEYLLPLAFLVMVFVAFGLAFRDRRVRSCGDCDSDCDTDSCTTRSKECDRGSRATISPSK
jgi:hypothetical protein